MTNYQPKFHNEFAFVPRMLSGMAGVAIGLMIATSLHWI